MQSIHDAGIDGEITPHDPLEGGEDVRVGVLGQVAERAEVDPENGGPAPPDQTGGGDHGAVAAEDDDQIGTVRQVLRGGPRRAGVEPRLASVGEHLEPPRRRPVEEALDDGPRAQLLAFDDEPDVPDLGLCSLPHTPPNAARL